MDKPISPELHGVLDYTTVLTTALAPTMFGFSDRASKVCYALAGGYLAVSAFTDYPLALRRLIPFPAHGAIEGTLGAALPMLPKLFGFEEDTAARNFLLGMTAVTALVASMTDWTGADTESPRPVQAARQQIQRMTGRVRDAEPEEAFAAV